MHSRSKYNGCSLINQKLAANCNSQLQNSRLFGAFYLVVLSFCTAIIRNDIPYLLIRITVSAIGHVILIDKCYNQYKYLYMFQKVSYKRQLSDV